MLSEDLTNLLPEKEYKELPDCKIFFGAKIKNLYDEKRIHINETHSPERYKVSKTGIFLYGKIFNILPIHRLLLTDLILKKPFDSIGYSTLLKKYNLSCDNYFYDLIPPLYPVDYTHVVKYFPDYCYEDFISFSPEIPKFQGFTSLHLYVIRHD